MAGDGSGGRGAAAGGPEIVEVAPGGSRGPGGAGGRPSSAVGRWVPALALGGLAVVIVGAGLLGPKREPARDLAPVTASPSSAAPAIAEQPPPTLRVPGPSLEDPWALLSGIWIDLARGSTGPDTGCGLERPITLAGGRIVCVVDQVRRGPDLVQTTHVLSVITVGRVRTADDAPAHADPPGMALSPVPLASLAGRSDRAIGDPVAIAVEPAAEPDVLLLAWAVLGDDGYHVGLDRYLVEDGRTVRRGTLEVATFPSESGTGGFSLADLAVQDAPDDRAALVGFTALGPSASAVRQLSTVAMTPGDTRDALGPATALAASAAANTAPRADGQGVVAAPCGGAFGEGWAAESSIFVVCPGQPTVLRRMALGDPSPEGDRPSSAGTQPTRTIDEIALTPAGNDPSVLAGNGVAIDRPGHRYYRWSPSIRTLWSIDLAAPPGAQAAADSLVLDQAGVGNATDIPAAADGSLRPVMALDPARDRLYLLAPGRGGAGAVVEVVGTRPIALAASWSVSPEPFAAVALSPDGGLLYLATGPRGFVGGPGPLAAVEVLETGAGSERLYAGWLPPGGQPPNAPVVR